MDEDEKFSMLVSVVHDLAEIVGSQVMVTLADDQAPKWILLANLKNAKVLYQIISDGTPCREPLGKMIRYYEDRLGLVGATFREISDLIAECTPHDKL